MQGPWASSRARRGWKKESRQVKGATEGTHSSSLLLRHSQGQLQSLLLSKSSLEQQSLGSKQFVFFLFNFAALGLHCWEHLLAFSSCNEQGLFSSCGTRASHCRGVSHCRAQTLEAASFSSCSYWAVEQQAQ